VILLADLNNEVYRSEHFNPFLMGKGLNFANGKSFFILCITKNMGHKFSGDSSLLGVGFTSKALFCVRMRFFFVQRCENQHLCISDSIVLYPR